MVQQQATSRKSRLAGMARQTSRAGAGHGRDAAQLVGLGFAAAGVVTMQMAFLVPAAFLLGWSVRRDPEHFYLEGFADGLAAAEVDAPGNGAGDRGGVRGLPEDALPDAAGPAPRPLVRGFGPAAGTEPIGHGLDARRGGYGSGPAGGAEYAPDGTPVARPKPTSIVPPAEFTGTAGLERFAARTAARSQAGPGIGPVTGKEV